MKNRMIKIRTFVEAIGSCESYYMERWINPDHVIFIREDKDNACETRIFMVNDIDFKVDGTVDEIAEKLS